MSVIDVWAQIPTQRFSQSSMFRSLRRWQGDEDKIVVPTRDQKIALMDEAGVDMALIAGWHGPEGSLISNEEVAEHVAAAPDRFRGLATVNLNEPMEAVREIRRWVDGKNFVGVRIVPWLWNLPPNDRRYYPVYAACVDAGVPFCTQIGHTGPLRSSETGRLIPYLEDVMLDFPDLKIVAGHVGFPWVNEVISMTVKFPNFYVDTSAYALKRLPPDFRMYMQTVGRGRVMFGTNWPMIPPAKCLEGLDGLGMKADEKDAFLGGLAQQVFNL